MQVHVHMQIYIHARLRIYVPKKQTIYSVAKVTRFAWASETAISVRAIRVSIAIMQPERALVLVHACSPVPEIARFACANEAVINNICACRVDPTFVHARGTCFYVRSCNFIIFFQNWIRRVHVRLHICRSSGWETGMIKQYAHEQSGHFSKIARVQTYVSEKESACK